MTIYRVKSNVLGNLGRTVITVGPILPILGTMLFIEKSIGYYMDDPMTDLIK